MLYNIFIFIFGWFLVSVIVALFAGPILAKGKSMDEKPDDQPGSKASPPDDGTREDRQIADLNLWLLRLQRG